MEKLLVVEDHRDTADLLRVFLRREFEVRVAASLEEAAPSMGWADLVLLDLGIGDLLPIEVARRVAEARPRRVVLHTGYPPTVTTPAAALVGAVAVVMKPIGLMPLLDVLRGALRGHA